VSTTVGMYRYKACYMHVTYASVSIPARSGVECFGAVSDPPCSDSAACAGLHLHSHSPRIQRNLQFWRVQKHCYLPAVAAAVAAEESDLDSA